MTIDELLTALAARGRDMRGSYHSYLAAGGQPDADRFLAHLTRERQVEGDLLAELCAEAKIELTAVSTDRLSESTDGAGQPQAGIADPTTGEANRALGEALVAAGLLTADACERILAELTSEGGRPPSLARELLARGLTRDRLERALAQLPAESRLCRSCGEPAVSGGPPPLLLGQIGRGAMGEIHVARDDDLGRKVAFKQLQREVATEPSTVRRFIAEAQITAQLDHPSIVPIYALRLVPGEPPAYTMKLVRGRSFKDVLTEVSFRLSRGETLSTGLALPARLEAFVKVCDALHYAHSKGVIHRDLKPANVMVGRYGEVYVMDWGVAVPRGAAELDAATARVDLSQISDDAPADATQEGQVVGTPAYMSPEQAHGFNSELGAPSDIHALGLLLFGLTTLTRAIPGNSTREVLANARLGELRPYVHAFGAALPPELGSIINRATAYHASARYASAAALADDVRRFLRGEQVSVHDYGPLDWGLRFANRHARFASLAAVAALLFGAFGLITLLTSPRSPTQPSTLAAALQTGSQAAELDLALQRTQLGLEQLAASAGSALTAEGTPPTLRLFLETPPREPLPELRPSARHGCPISLTSPSGLAAAGSHDALRRLAQLTPQLRARYQADGPLRVRWLHLVTRDGSRLSYPGRGGAAAGVEPADLALGRDRPGWRAGHSGTTCAVPIAAPDGRALGVLVARFEPADQRTLGSDGLATSGDKDANLLRRYLLSADGLELTRLPHGSAAYAEPDSERQLVSSGQIAIFPLERGRLLVQHTLRTTRWTLAFVVERHPGR